MKVKKIDTALWCGIILFEHAQKEQSYIDLWSSSCNRDYKDGDNSFLCWPLTRFNLITNCALIKAAK